MRLTKFRHRVLTALVVSLPPRAVHGPDELKDGVLRVIAALQLRKVQRFQLRHILSGDRVNAILVPLTEKPTNVGGEFCFQYFN